MPQQRTIRADMIRKALRPDKEIKLRVRVSGPLDLLRLREEVQRRILPTRGRPSDSSWDRQRLIRFKAEVWQELKQLSEQLRHDEVTASPGQLAAIIVEEGVKALRRRR